MNTFFFSDTEMFFFPSADCYLLHGHLGHQIKGGKVCTGEAVFVLAHLDGIKPLIHRTEAGEIRDAAVQEREMNATEDKNKDSTKSALSGRWWREAQNQPNCWSDEHVSEDTHPEDNGVMAFSVLGLRIILSRLLTIWLNLGRLLRSFCQQSNMSWCSALGQSIGGGSR